MLSNLHTHTTFCDGKNTAEEIVISAIEKGFSVIGFTSHGYTPFDLRYCMQDTDGYNDEIRRLKQKYKNDIRIYNGIEEDMLAFVKREDYDYIIGSAHYIYHNGNYYSIDSGRDYTERCLEAFSGNSLEMAEAYYQTFCNYILMRKPDIVGHFDLLTKFDEKFDPIFLSDENYHKIAEKYLLEAIRSDCIFEINSGAMSRGYRKTPYPYENLLYILKNNNAKIILSSDSHSKETLDFGFSDMRNILKDIGFLYTYSLDNDEFVKIEL